MTNKEAFRQTILRKLREVALKDCPECGGEGVVDVGAGDTEKLIACNCTAMVEDDTDD